jgi:quercetin dioxygenase-like cupin family protein
MTQSGLFHLHLQDEEKMTPRVYAYYFKHWNEFRMPLHRHDSTEIMYVMNGTCRVEVELPAARNRTLRKFSPLP